MSNSNKSSQIIRQEFLDFFQSKKHTIVSSASLVPDNDQTLLFTNAGMNQFKDVFLATGSRPYTRATDTQKVMRVSGKHNDFDDVGRDTYHHTFFEMLGNWSFGDYYKKEAIIWAWELLTEVWGLPKERLYATVYNSDEESANIWKTETDINPDHVLFFDEKDNFWEMGVTGPCGPCSEIHIDLTKDLSKSIGAKGVNADDPLFMELWNLVFIQYNRQEDGSLADLPSKHVDTGMGFERIVAVLQNKNSNYDSDLFTPIIDFLGKDSGIAYTDDTQGTPHRVIADHIRALTFAIGDGIIPSNEGRGYVIRKILRRAIRFGKELGYTNPFLYKLVAIVTEIMGSTFPEIHDRKASIESVIKAEEESFFRTLNKGFDKIKELIAHTKSTKNTTISGEDVFLLYDSMGFPVDFTEQILKDEDLNFDQKRFAQLMEEQKERARAAWKGEGINFSAFGNLPKTSYVGENEFQNDATILGIVIKEKKVSSCKEGDDIAIILDRTVFYGEKGGQVGDSGLVKSGEENIIEIFDTKIFEGKYVHLGKVLKGFFKDNQTVVAVVNQNRKKDIARNHSAAHLLFKALRAVLGNHIGQAGSFVAENRARIDFTHPKAVSPEELQEITKIVNQDIIDNHQTFITEMPIDQAKATGAIAAFEEKYGDIVRVVTMGDSIELCGGTHINYTGELGILAIVEESSVSAGTRRLEAYVGKTAFDYIQKVRSLEKKVTQVLKCGDHEIISKIEKIIEDSKAKDKELKKLNAQLAGGIFDTFLEKAFTIGTHKIIIENIVGDGDTVLDLTNHFRDKVNSGILVLGVKKSDGEALLSVRITENLTDKIQAGNIIKEISPIIGGKGGGRADQAMAGGKDSSQLEKALKSAKEMITSTLA